MVFGEIIGVFNSFRFNGNQNHLISQHLKTCEGVDY